MTQEYSILITEGHHDRAVIERVLKLNGFSSVKKDYDVPECFKTLVPSKYPFNDNFLHITNPTPHFRHKNNNHVAIITAGGADTNKLATAFKRLSEISLVYWKQIKFIGILVDADRNTAEKQMCRVLNDIEKNVNLQYCDFTQVKQGFITAYSKKITFAVYVFPNNLDEGTIENVILEGANTHYNNLLLLANNYLRQILTPHNNEMNKSTANYNKALVGVMANVLNPGKANQVSIYDNNWFTAENISIIPTHHALYNFLHQHINLN